MSTISPNMGLVVPTVADTLGPYWANDINADLSVLDQHDHSTGQGVQITPAGLNINSDLSFLDNNAIAFRSTRFQVQGSPLALGTDIGCLYVSGVDLYFNDENGNQIRMTQSGSVAGSTGTITGLPSGTASASYSAGSQTFVFQSATNTSANLDGASLILRNLTASSKGLTLSPPNAMASDYSLTLPSVAGGSNYLMTLNASGVMGSIVGVDTANIVNGAVTRPKQAAVGQQISSSCGTFTTSSSSYVDVTNLNVTITTTGRPVILALISDGSAADIVGASGTPVVVAINNGSSNIAQIGLRGNTATTWNMSPASIWHMDTPSASTITYTVKMLVNGTSGSMVNCKLIAYEL